MAKITNKLTIEQKITEEDKMILQFVQKYPYPDHEDMLAKLNYYVDLYTEYSKLNHDCCKIIYENPNNEEIILNMGKQIYKNGGIKSLKATHRILKYFSPYWSSSNIIVKSHGSMIEVYFQSVTSEWKS